jgi:nucleoside-diphosphate-sugar epimerase
VHPAYVDDVVAGILLAAERGRPGERYIVGGPQPVTKRELVFTIADALGVRRPSLAVPRLAAEVAARLLEPLGRLCRVEPILTRSRVMMMADNFGYSIEKARRELGYEPRTGLRDGIARTIHGYVESGLL